MDKLSDWQVYEKHNKISGIEVRKIKGDHEVGISVYKNLYEGGQLYAETFLNREDAWELILALKEYFKL